MMADERGKQGKTDGKGSRPLPKRKGQEENGGPAATEEGAMARTNDNKRMRDGGQSSKELPNAGVGVGPCWRLLDDKVAEDAGRDIEARRRCEMLLEQALSCSIHTDVRFVFQDGTSDISGHLAMLCGVSKFFEVMHACGLEESRTREVRIVGISRESFLGFLEWLYLGRGGQQMAKADGREVWLLAERYQVDGVKEWLMREGIDPCGVCAAAQYALYGDGEGRDELLKACRTKIGSMDLSLIDEACLRGVSACALREVLEGHCCASDGVLEGERGMERFRLLSRWVKANDLKTSSGVCKSDEIDRLIDAVDLTRVPFKFISKVVRPSGLVTAQRLLEVEAQSIRAVCVGDVRMSNIDIYGEMAGEGDGFSIIAHITATQTGERDRIAFCCPGESIVLGFSANWSGQEDFVIGFNQRSEEIPGGPRGVAFNKQGELFVSDQKGHKIFVYRNHGDFVRMFGKKGNGDGQFDVPAGLAVNSQGEIVVCDSGNHRVQILKDNGTFVRKFGCKGTDDGQFNSPEGVAVGPDGSIVVADLGNARVQVFNSLGEHQMTIGCKGEGRGQFLEPYGVSVGMHGEIVVSDVGRRDMQVFNKSGQFMQCIGRGGDRPALGSDEYVCGGVGVDGQGRVFVAVSRTRYTEFGDMCNPIKYALELIEDDDNDDDDDDDDKCGDDDGGEDEVCDVSDT